MAVVDAEGVSRLVLAPCGVSRLGSVVGCNAVTGFEVSRTQMAVAVCEVEVKYRVVDLGALEAALAARDIVLSAPVTQDDQAYARGITGSRRLGCRSRVCGPSVVGMC